MGRLWCNNRTSKRWNRISLFYTENGVIVGALVIVAQWEMLLTQFLVSFGPRLSNLKMSSAGMAPGDAIYGSALKYSKINSIKEELIQQGIVATNATITKSEAACYDVCA